MPRQFVPRQSGAHRIAAIALYRALITQCKAVPLDLHRQHELQYIVQNRFKQVRNLKSTRRLKLYFEAGYEAIDQLDAAVAGDVQSREYILSLLARAPADVKAAPPPYKLPKYIQKQLRKKERQLEERSTVDEKPPKPSIFDRRPLSLEKLTGARHVPVLFNANGIPVLRFKKPQPSNLSNYIRSRINLRQKRQDQCHRLEDELELASAEDEWDEIVEVYGELRRGGGDEEEEEDEKEENDWVTAINQALTDLEKALAEEKEKNRVMATRMQELVDRERELFQQERAEKFGRVRGELGNDPRSRSPLS